VVSDAYETGLPRVVAGVAAVWQVAIVVQVIAYLPDYRQPAVVIGVWLAMLVAAVWLVPRAWAGGLNRRQAVATLVIGLAAVIAVGLERKHGAHGSVDWSVIGTVGLLALVAASQPAWLWISGAVAEFVAHTILAICILGLDTLDLARLAATVFSLVVILVVVALARPATASYARIAVRRATLLSQAAAEHAAAEAIRADRRERLALLETEALPLLRGIADGTLDPADPDIQRQCGRYATTLRQSLTGRSLVGPSADAGLLAGLRPALRLAQARGLPLELQVVGDPGRPSRAVAEATLAVVDGLIRERPPNPVTLTVLATDADVELYVAFSERPAAIPPLTGPPGLASGAESEAGPDHWSASMDIDADTGAGCLEVRWRKPVPA
jgi:hypothetical protein